MFPFLKRLPWNQTMLNCVKVNNACNAGIINQINPSASTYRGLGVVEKDAADPTEPSSGEESTPSPETAAMVLERL